MALLDSGNVSDRPTPEGDAKTRALVAGMKRMGYAVVNVGERDIKMGIDAFERRTAESGLPFISANIVRQDTQEPVFEPSVVIEAVSGNGEQRARIGVIGIVRYNPIFLKAGPEKTNTVIVNPLERVKQEMEKLQAQKLDSIVLLAALNKHDAAQIAREVPGIDFVVGSYGGVFTTREEKQGNAFILYSGNQGKRVGATRVFLGADGRVERQATKIHFLTARYPSDPEMLEFVKTVPRGPQPGRARSLKPVERGGPFAGTRVCKSCHEAAGRQWDATPHAHAFATLQKDGKDGDAGCRSCHVTGAPPAQGFQDLATTPHLANVSCESCHGPGRQHAADRRPGYGAVTLENCSGCHTVEHSPAFDYYTYLSQVTHGSRAAK